jgi:hypothetical protein
VVDGESPSGETAAGAAGDDGSWEVHSVHECDQIGGKVRGPVTGWGAGGVSVTSLGESEDVDGGGQVGQDSFERVPGVGDGVKEDEGDPRRISLLHLGKPHIVGSSTPISKERHVRPQAIGTSSGTDWGAKIGATWPLRKASVLSSQGLAPRA